MKDRTRMKTEEVSIHSESVSTAWRRNRVIPEASPPSGEGIGSSRKRLHRVEKKSGHPGRVSTKWRRFPLIRKGSPPSGEGFRLSGKRLHQVGKVSAYPGRVSTKWGRSPPIRKDPRKSAFENPLYLRLPRNFRVLKR